MGYFKKPVLEIEESGESFLSFLVPNFLRKTHLLYNEGGEGETPGSIVSNRPFYGGQVNNIRLITKNETDSPPASAYIFKSRNNGKQEKAPWQIYASGKTYLNNRKVGPVPKAIKNKAELRTGGEEFRILTDPHMLCHLRHSLESEVSGIYSSLLDWTYQLKGSVGSRLNGIYHSFRFPEDSLERKEKLTQP